MGLLEEALRERPMKGPRCTIAVLLDTLAEDDRAELIEAMADRTVSSSGLVRAMKRRGWDAPQQQVMQRHRRGECRCG